MQERKKRLRKEILARRETLLPEEREEKSGRICRRLIKDLKHMKEELKQGVLFTFVPFGDEVGILPVLKWCWSNGISVAVPKSIPETRELHLYLVDAMEDLQPGIWGILEPKTNLPLLEDLSRISCVLVPGVAFDPQLRRLGYGGGYYDRFFHKLDGLGLDPAKWAPLFEVQLVAEVPSASFDRKVDRLITEERVIGVDKA